VHKKAKNLHCCGEEAGNRSEVRAVVFDLDGVLVDSSERFLKCLDESKNDKQKFWSCFLSEKYMDLDRPREEYIRILREYLSKGYRIVIVTGRVEERQKDKTLKQLSQWGITFHEIYFRKAGDYRKDWEFKIEIIDRILRKCEIEAVYDDSDRVIEEIKRRHPEIKVYKVIRNT